QTSNRSFSALALLHSGQRSAATIPFIQHSQNEKILDYLVSFLSDFSIRTCTEIQACAERLLLSFLTGTDHNKREQPPHEGELQPLSLQIGAAEAQGIPCLQIQFAIHA
ncbi:MAG: hypothetical protein IJQ33_10865, partial [Clostridia bacterium]|nr:hypothetical protein [Clostridia bacterium]